MNWIDTIRQKPRAAKVRIMWTVAVIVAILLIVVWIISWKISKNNSAASNLFQNAHSQFNNDQNYYQKTLENQGGTIPDSIKKVH